MTERSEAVRAWSHFLGASALVIRDIERRLKSAGQPSMAWYDVLLELERAGGGLRLHELSDKLVIERYNVTRLLDRMEADGVITRERAGDDRRGMIAVITGKGLEQRKTAWPAYQAAIEGAFGAAFDAADAATLTGLMKKLIGHHRR